MVSVWSGVRLKPCGIRAARKLRVVRRNERWADKHYKKGHNISSIKANVLGGATMAKGIVLEKVGVEAKQPNSAIRKCVRVQLIKNGKKITAFVPRDGCLNFVDENDEVLIAGFGRSGHAVGDIPGVRFKVVCVSKTSLLALFRGKKEKPHS
ncbi:hypothetical protein WA538_006049 [Blastocystis sp. DL]